MITRPLTKQDYDHIVQVIDRWWGGPANTLAHPLFHHELGGLARVVEQDAMLVGFLFGFICRDSERGYVHLVGIHPDFRRKGVGKVLYQSFEEDCLTQGCRKLKSVTLLGNTASIAFHQSQGWTGGPVENYAGPGRTRIVFEKTLA